MHSYTVVLLLPSPFNGSLISRPTYVHVGVRWVSTRTCRFHRGRWRREGWIVDREKRREGGSSRGTTGGRMAWSGGWQDGREGVRGQVRTDASSKPWHSPPHGVHRSCRPLSRLCATRLGRRGGDLSREDKERERERERDGRLFLRSFPSLRSPFRISLSCRDCGGRAQMYEPNEIDAKKRAEVLVRPTQLRYVGARVRACIHACIRV